MVVAAEGCSMPKVQISSLFLTFTFWSCAVSLGYAPVNQGGSASKAFIEAQL